MGQMLCWKCGTTLWLDMPLVRRRRKKPLVVYAACPSCEQKYKCVLELA
jgi:hypothetical protein